MKIDLNEIYNKIVDLQNKCKSIEKEIYLLNFSKSTLEQEIRSFENEIKERSKKIDIFNEAALFLQKLEDLVKQLTFNKIETMVTEALQDIYTDNKLSFKIISSVKKNGILDIKFYLENKSLRRSFNIMKSFGGGIKDIISMTLRIIFLELLKIKGPVILDEVGKHISVEYQELFGKFIKQISESLNRQFILISHEDTMISTANKILKCSLNNNITNVEEM